MVKEAMHTQIYFIYLIMISLYMYLFLQEFLIHHLTQISTQC